MTIFLLIFFSRKKYADDDDDQFFLNILWMFLALKKMFLFFPYKLELNVVFYLKKNDKYIENLHFILSSSSEFVSCRIIFLDFVFSLFILSSNGQSYRLRYSWIFTIVKFHLEWQYKNERVENNLVNGNPAINTYMFGYVALTNNRLNIWKSLDSSSVCYVCVCRWKHRETFDEFGIQFFFFHSLTSS